MCAGFAEIWGRVICTVQEEGGVFGMQMPFRKGKLRPQLIFMHFFFFFLRLLCSNQSIHKANVGRREREKKEENVHLWAENCRWINM